MIKVNDSERFNMRSGFERLITFNLKPIYELHLIRGLTGEIHPNIVICIQRLITISHVDSTSHENPTIYIYIHIYKEDQMRTISI